MLGVSFFELIIIMLVMLIVFGPQRLPAMARNLARLFQQLQTMTDKFQSEMQALGKEDLKENYTAINNTLKDGETDKICNQSPQKQ